MTDRYQQRNNNNLNRYARSNYSGLSANSKNNNFNASRDGLDKNKVYRIVDNDANKKRSSSNINNSAYSDCGATNKYYNSTKNNARNVAKKNRYSRQSGSYSAKNVRAGKYTILSNEDISFKQESTGNSNRRTNNGNYIRSINNSNLANQAQQSNGEHFSKSRPLYGSRVLDVEANSKNLSFSPKENKSNKPKLNLPLVIILTVAFVALLGVFIARTVITMPEINEFMSLSSSISTQESNIASLEAENDKLSKETQTYQATIDKYEASKN